MKNNSFKKANNIQESSILFNEMSTFSKEEPTRSGNINHLYKSLNPLHNLDLNHRSTDLNKDNQAFWGSITKISSEKYKELYDFAPSAYFTLSHEDYIIELNLAVANMIGIAHSDYKSQPFSSFITDDTLPIYNHFIRNIFNNNTKVSCEVSLHSDFNTIKHVILTGIANEDGNQCLVNMIDISRQKEAEKLLIIAKKELAFQIYEKELLAEKLIIAKEKAEGRVKLKSVSIANMGHEIKTPLNCILGYSDLLKQTDLEPDTHQFCISMIEKGGIRLLNIVNNLLSVAKRESVQTEVSINQCNINEQIEYISDFFKLEVEQKGLQISFQNSLPDCEAIVDTDSEKIYGILTNLVKNAISYCDEGIIEIGYTLKPVSQEDTLFSGLFCDHHEPASNLVEVEFYVKDTGIGIPINMQEAIFSRYFQADNNDKRAAHGVGLGLAISKSYVEMLGGKIWVESEHDNGSTFYFTIPYTCKHSEYPDKTKGFSTANIEREIKYLKILIADDDLSLGMLQAELVKNNSALVLNVTNGIEAIEALKSHNDLDLILLDINMPKMNGFEAAEHIRKSNKDVIIIAQTVCPQEEEIAMAFKAGCNDYVQKTLNKSTMLDLLKKYFGNSLNQSGELNNIVVA